MYDAPSLSGISQGSYLIPLSYLLSCFSASLLALSVLSCLVHLPDLKKTQIFFVKS